MAPELAEPIRNLVEELSRLPGIGRKSAQRLAFHLLRGSLEDSRRLADTIIRVKEGITFCSTCFSFTDVDPCAICADPQRDRGLICVVQDPGDIFAIERAGGYRGLYHVLQGALSPLKGIGPESLRLAELEARVAGGTGEKAGAAAAGGANTAVEAAAGEPGGGTGVPVREVILATNPDVEGEATSAYIYRLLKPKGIVLTRIGFGLPVGGSLEYADEVTMARAIEGRREI